MYYADVFVSRRWFQHTGGWVAVEKDENIKYHINVMLGRCYRALFHIDQATYLHNAALGQFNEHASRITANDGHVRASSPLIAGLIIELCEALSAIRIVQNELWELTSIAARKKHEQRTDAPSSLHEAIQVIKRHYRQGEKRPKWLSLIDVEIKKYLLDYWENHGASLKDYRDLDQHHEVIATNGILQVVEPGKLALLIPLPDNPSTKSPKAFTYDRHIDGLKFATEAFIEVHRLIEKVAEHFSNGAPVAPIPRLFSPFPAIQHTPGIERTTAIVIWDMNGRDVPLFAQTSQMTVRLTTL